MRKAPKSFQRTENTKNLQFKKIYGIIYTQNKKNNLKKEVITMKKLTKKEMFALMQEAFEAKVIPENADELAEFCAKEITALDNKAVKAKEYAAKKRAENDGLADVVLDALTGDFTVIDDIVAAILADGVEISKQKAVYRLTKLVEEGAAEKTQVTVPATEGKKARKVTAYRKV